MFLGSFQLVHGSCSCKGSQPWHAPPAHGPQPGYQHPAHPEQAPAVPPAVAARTPLSAWPGLKNDPGPTPPVTGLFIEDLDPYSGCPAGLRYHVKILMNPWLSSASSKSFSRRRHTVAQGTKPPSVLVSLVTRATLWWATSKVSKNFQN